jgi:transposase InsO family protein
MRRAYYAQRRTRFQQCCRSLGIEHWLTSPHRQKTKGKVKRFFRTLDEGCLLVHEANCSELRIRDVGQFV